MMVPTSLRCMGVRKNFGGVTALWHIDLEIVGPTIAAIIGPNGAGKTTLLNVFTGFIRPDVGRCFLAEHEITHLPPHQIAQLGVARSFQELRLIFKVSVLENILLAISGQHDDNLLNSLFHLGLARKEAGHRKNAMTLLQFIGLADMATELAGNLSYGQQKLLTLACCLALQPRILLLDEPIAGIHPEMASHILGLLQRLRHEGKLVIFIEHDIAAVRQVADFVIVMDEGRLVVQGPAKDVLRRPEIMDTYVA